MIRLFLGLLVTAALASAQSFPVKTNASGAVTEPSNLLVNGAQGGTGVANTGKTITIGGNLTTSGAFSTTLTATGNTTLTLPTSGTLATSADLAAGYQPLDADLTAIAALTTTSYGRATLSLADAAAGRTYVGLVIGVDVQAYDADLAALAANSTSGFWARTGAGTGAARTITAGTGLNVTNGDGVAGNASIALANTAVIAGTYGSATAAPVITVDAQGRITASSNTTVTPAVGAITGLGTGVATLLAGTPSGTGGLAGTTSPTLTTPNIGAATGTSLSLTGGNITVSQSAADPTVHIRATANTYNPILRFEGFDRNFYLGVKDNGADGTLNISGAAALTSPILSLDPATNGTALSGNLAVSGTGATTLGGTGATVAIAATSAIRGVRTAAATLDFPSVAATGGTQDLTITVTGAATGDTVALGLPAAPAGGITFNAWVSASNTVTVRATNATGGAIDPASASYRATVTSF